MLAATPSSNGELLATLDRAHHLARAGLEEARRAVGALHDADLPGPDRLEQLTAEFSRDSSIEATLEVTGTPHRLDSQRSLTLFRVAQEALTNSRKHAQPQRIELQLAYEPDGTRLVVQDHCRQQILSIGKATARPAGGARPGYGLTGMRERAELIGGRLEASPAGDGFRVELVDPGVSGETITVVIVDDQRVVREGLSMVLGLMPDVEIVGSASDGEEALALVKRLAPQVVLMDLRMPRLDGVEATHQITERHPNTKVVVLTTYADDHSVIQALRAGACGFLTKDATGQQIRDALGAAVRGEAAIDPAVQHHLVNSIARTAPLRWTPPDQSRLPDGLTPREAEVLALVSEGLSNAEIAQRLVVTETTVKSHINHLYTKTGARDRAQAVAYAYRNGLAPDAPNPRA